MSSMNKKELVEIKKGQTGTGLLIENDGYISLELAGNKKLFEVEAPHILHFGNPILRAKIPFQIVKLLLIIADGLIRQLSRPTVKTELRNSIRKPHTKTPLSFDKSHWKEGKTFIIPASLPVREVYRTKSTFYVPDELKLNASIPAKP